MTTVQTLGQVIVAATYKGVRLYFEPLRFLWSGWELPWKGNSTQRDVPCSGPNWVSELPTQASANRRSNLAPLPWKRLFDILSAVLVLIITAPLCVLVAVAVLVEDGSPVFVALRRETVGGREFLLLKFRTMIRDAEKIRQALATHNQVDGPQFFIERDPRLTRIGRLLRNLGLDELPAFWNVLLGHMSIVGPRPNPSRENQCCPAWREARLSVRPGITGLWQVMRTYRKGMDFQEWVKYDIAYVEQVSWRLDLWILWRTLVISLLPTWARASANTELDFGPQASEASERAMAEDYNLRAIFHSRQGNHAEAELMLQKALALHRKFGGLRAIAGNYMKIGVICKTRGDWVEAERMVDRALRIYLEIHEDADVAEAYTLLGLIAQLRGHLAEAEQMYTEALKVHEHMGEPDNLVRDYTNLGALLMIRGETRRADEMSAKARDLDRSLQER